MMTYAKVIHKLHILRNLTGLSPKELTQPTSAFECVYEAHLEAQDKQRLSELPAVLFSVSTVSPLQEAQGFFFSVNQSHANWIHRLHETADARAGDFGVGVEVRPGP